MERSMTNFLGGRRKVSVKGPQACAQNNPPDNETPCREEKQWNDPQENGDTRAPRQCHQRGTGTCSRIEAMTE